MKKKVNFKEIYTYDDNMMVLPLDFKPTAVAIQGENKVGLILNTLSFIDDDGNFIKDYNRVGQFMQIAEYVSGPVKKMFNVFDNTDYLTELINVKQIYYSRKLTKEEFNLIFNI